MTAHLVVVTPGMLTTVQDLGRFGYQDLGVPVCGAIDAISLRLANALVGNPEDTGALEIRFVGPTLRVAAESLRVALTGTATPIEILGGRTVRVEAGRSVTVKKGDVLRIGTVADTSCCYLAVGGGFALPAPFGSQSTYDKGGFGGLDGRTLREGDRLPLARNKATAHPEVGLGEPVQLDAPGPIRVVLGPQEDHFTEAGIRTLLESEFTLSPQSDRMGLRLDGPAIEHSRGFNILSDGIAAGSIQVPGTGKPIILLADRQTTGGYPKIATVVSADLARLGRLRPGRKLRFAAVSVAEAEQIRREMEADIRRHLKAIAPVDVPREPDTAALLAANLISGVVGREE